MKADVMRAMRQRKASPLSEAPVKMQGHAERSEAPVKDKVMLNGKVLRGKVLRGKVLRGKVMLNGKVLRARC